MKAVPQLGCVSKVSGETGCIKSWDQFDEYDSHSLRYVKQVSEKIKDHRLEKYKSNLNISEKSLRHEI